MDANVDSLAAQPGVLLVLVLDSAGAVVRWAGADAERAQQQAALCGPLVAQARVFAAAQGTEEALQLLSVRTSAAEYAFVADGRFVLVVAKAIARP
eukprot:TRINITY_DN1285_c0_g1_i2.p3 TRINITY_DN1285_c0_g1~~TRINITY_DN1285_c0_g1_i2.p3  ORF type:complete len:112 (-),score=34.62 TRINITY_DN1285_c0_g1_i2:47-334(-)